jgi:NADH-quinone oxidoreductase subunit C
MSDYGFKGHFFRKDFPLIGFGELNYSEKEKKIVFNSVEVASEYKLYN